MYTIYDKISKNIKNLLIFFMKGNEGLQYNIDNNINKELNNFLSNDKLDTAEAKALTEIFDANKEKVIILSKENLSKLRKSISTSSNRNYITGREKNVIKLIGENYDVKTTSSNLFNDSDVSEDNNNIEYNNIENNNIENNNNELFSYKSEDSSRLTDEKYLKTHEVIGTSSNFLDDYIDSSDNDDKIRELANSDVEIRKLEDSNIDITGLKINNEEKKQLNNEKVEVVKLEKSKEIKEEENKVVKINNIDKLNNNFTKSDILAQAKLIPEDKMKKLQLILGFKKGNGIDGAFGNNTFNKYINYCVKNNHNWKEEGITIDFVNKSIEKNKKYIIAKLLKIISIGEGTNDNYDAIFNKGKQSRVKYSEMTLHEILEKQERMGKFTAIGKYQFINTTLTELIQKNNFDINNQKFDSKFQDNIAIMKLEKRGLNKYLSGKISLGAFQKQLSMEWASLPKDISGKSYYHSDGINKANDNKEVQYSAISNELTKFI